ncbi:MAG: hypothetical protein Q4E00_00515 [Actinomyces bowdenii]|nr:hypothetical protein [Actinomyces bowdenii]
MSRSLLALRSRLLPVLLVMLLPAFVVVCAPPAAAAYGDSHLRYTLTFREDGKVDVDVILVEEGGSSSELDDFCDISNFSDTDGDITVATTEIHGDPACRITVKGMSMSSADDFLGTDVSVRHKEKTYEVVFDSGTFDSMDKAEVAVVFPGDVESASKSGKIDGNTVRWDNAQREGEMRAEGADSPGVASWVWAVLLLVVLGGTAGVVTAVVMSRRKKQRQAMAVPAQMGVAAPVGQYLPQAAGQSFSGYAAGPSSQVPGQQPSAYAPVPEFQYAPGQPVPGQYMADPAASTQPLQGHYAPGQSVPGQYAPEPPQDPNQDWRRFQAPQP